MWWLWPHLRRVWTVTGAVVIGLTVTFIYSALTQQPVPHLSVVSDLMSDYWPWLAVILVTVTVVSVIAEREHRRHAGAPVLRLGHLAKMVFRDHPMPWLIGLASLFGALAHTALAGVLFNWKYDWKTSNAEFTRAIDLNPNYAYAHDGFAQSLAFQGRLDEALAEGKRATELDPLSVTALMDTSWALMSQGRYDAARDQARKMLDLDPSSFWGPWTLGFVDIEADKPADAITESKKATALESPSFVLAYLGYAYGVSGDRVHAMAQIDEMNKRALHGSVPAYNLAIVYLGIGDRERAMDLLEKAYAEDSELLEWLKVDRMFDPLRQEPRFIALLKKVNLDN